MTILLVSFFVMLLFRMPISFATFFSSLFYLIANDIPITVAVQRILAGADSFPLLAIPFFILSGSIMNSGGITEKLFAFTNKLVGHITGGMAHACVLASMIFAGMSGSAVAEAGGLGAVELKGMKQAGYDKEFSIGVIGAGAIIGPIIPPSIVAVIFAVASGVSVGKLLIAGIVPGVLMGLTLSVVIYFQCKKRGYVKAAKPSFSEVVHATKEAFFPMLTPVILVGGIASGIFTPTEAAIIAVVYALVLGGFNKTISFRDAPRFLRETALVTCNVMFIIASSALFGWVLARAGVPQLVSQYFISMISNKFTALIVLNIFLLIVGMFMDNSAAIPILTPVLIPVILQYGIDPVHFGLIMILNLIIGLLTPPVGLVLYVLNSLSNIPMEKIAKSLMPYLISLIVLLYIISFVPDIALFLPNLLFGK